MEALCENKMCEITKYFCYFSKYLSIIAEQSGVDPSECQERSGYYMISEQSVNTLKLSHQPFYWISSCCQSQTGSKSILFKNKHIDEAKQAGYKLSWG